MINWQYFPKSDKVHPEVGKVVGIFQRHEKAIKSPENTLKSNQVLDVIREPLQALGYKVEGKGKGKFVRVPVLYGKNGNLEKAFHADAYSIEHGIVIEVEAGRAVDNNQFLKDLFQSSLMHDVDYLVIAVRNYYRIKADNPQGYKEDKDFRSVYKFLETLYVSDRIQLPLKGILLIGY